MAPGPGQLGSEAARQEQQGSRKVRSSTRNAVSRERIQATPRLVAQMAAGIFPQGALLGPAASPPRSLTPPPTLIQGPREGTRHTWQHRPSARLPVVLPSSPGRTRKGYRFLFRIPRHLRAPHSPTLPLQQSHRRARWPPRALSPEANTWLRRLDHLALLAPAFLRKPIYCTHLWLPRPLSA